MPIRGIQEYARLRALGDDTLEERMELLVKHRSVLKNEIASMLQNLDALNDKIDYYQSEIKNAGSAPGARAAELTNHTLI